MAQPKGQSAMSKTMLATIPRITLPVNNAGVGALEPLLQSDVDAMGMMIDLNVTALTRLTYAVAPALVARGGGAIINVGSVVAIAPEDLNGVDGATKAFVLALSLSLHKDLADKKVRIQAVLPGATATNFWDVPELGPPAITVAPGQFLLKDVGPLAASFWPFVDSLKASAGS
jgi:short-subunit dehydrogenase